MTIIDAQLHEPAVAGDSRGLDRDTRYRLMLEVELGYMDAVGVDKAVLFPIERRMGPVGAEPRRPTASRSSRWSPRPPCPAASGRTIRGSPSWSRGAPRRGRGCVAMRAMHTLPGPPAEQRPDD